MSGLKGAMDAPHLDMYLLGLVVQQNIKEFSA
jgi:hypothetical protein